MLSNKFSRTVKKSWRLYYNSIPLRNKIYIIVGIIVLLYIIASHRDISSEKKLRRKTFSVHGKHVDSGYLKHVYKVFDVYGYDRVGTEDDWDVLWSHDYPFNVMNKQLMQMKPSQMVNHIPGSGYITNKMNLARLKSPYIPQAYLLPKEMDELVKHKASNPTATYVLKSNNHRGIRIVNDMKTLKNSNNSFAQLYVSNPLLIDNHKFDIGVYTFITSINPLRIHIFNDILFRFCPEPYNPFDPTNVNKYVVGDDYKPLWLTRLNKHYGNGYSMKNSFDAYIQSIGKEPDVIWTQVDDAIRSIILQKEPSLIQSSSRFKNGKFFEMMRFDFVIDADFNVFLMEANMSPNLSSAHFAPNQELYEQVLFALFSTVGLAYGPMKPEARDLEVNNRQIMTGAHHCAESECMGCSDECIVCSHCLSDTYQNSIRDSIHEHFHRVNTRRVFPPAGKENLKQYDVSGLSKENQMLVKWFYAKCADDPSFCN